MFYTKMKLQSREIFLELNHTDAGNPQQGIAPSYHFEICLSDGTKIGTCDLRIGHDKRLFYAGNIGYRIAPSYRGHHYAAKACRLLFHLAARHHMGYVLITCNPENMASARTCKLLGCTELGTVKLPPEHEMYQCGEQKTHFPIYFSIKKPAELLPYGFFLFTSCYLLRRSSMLLLRFLEARTATEPAASTSTSIPAAAPVFGLDASSESASLPEVSPLSLPELSSVLPSIF